MPRLRLGLTPEQVAKRRNSIGGSDCNIIMNGDDSALLNLWRFKTGQAEAEDLSRVLPVVFGSFTEPLNLHWYEQSTGRAVTDEQKGCADDWRTCTLDGMTTTESGHPAVFEAKCVNAFSDADAVAQRYMPQLHWNGLLAGVDWGVLSAFIGTLKYEFFEVELDPFYQAAVVERAEAFWASVQSGTPPVFMPAVEAPKVSAFREVDMRDSNAWAMHAGTWLDNRDAAKQFASAEKEIKGLIEADVSRAWGFGVECKRSKNGSLRISEMKR